MIPELGRSPGEGNGYPLQYSGLENSVDCIVHGVAKSWDRSERLSLFAVSCVACFVFLFTMNVYIVNPPPFLLQKNLNLQKP